MIIDLNPAGAQEGALTIYSKKALTAGEATNCKITTIESAGENLYKVYLTGRPWDQAQTLTLNIAP